MQKILIYKIFTTVKLTLANIRWMMKDTCPDLIIIQYLDKIN